MAKPKGNPAPVSSEPSQNQISVQGIQLAWKIKKGTCHFQGLPVAMMWVDSTLAGLMSGVAAMVGPERFSLALQSEGRKSVESDWDFMSRYPDFRDGFNAIRVIAAVAGWGEWQFVGDTRKKQECRFRAYNSWEGLYQKKLGVSWGSAMLAGKFAGYCTKRFGTNCWATQTSFIARNDPYDEFVVAPSPRIIENEINSLLSSDQATRADLTVALTRLQKAQAQLLANQNSLEQQVQQRTSELAASLALRKAINNKLKLEVAKHRQTEMSRRQTEELLQKIIEHAPISMAIVSMEGKIEYINQKSIDTFGFNPEDIPTMERWWLQAYPDPKYRRSVVKKWMGHVKSAIAEGREIQRDNYHVTCKDGTVKTISIFGVIVANKVFVMFDDVTIQARKADKLRRSRTELERRVQLRTAELAERNRLLQAEIVERRQVEKRLVQANVSLEHTMTQLRKLGAKLSQVEELERKRMAHILHDQLQQLLVAANFSLSTLEQNVSGKELRATARAARTAVDEAIRESKSLVLDLSPPILREGGIAAAIKWIRIRMQEKHGLTLQTKVDKHASGIGEDLRLAIFHAVRELLLNVVKHAGVSSAKVAITVIPKNRVQVVVSDEGRGFDAIRTNQGDNVEFGFGLLAIRERFDAIGGSMKITSKPEHGCRVTLTVPLTNDLAPAGIVSKDRSFQAQAITTDVADRQRVPTTKSRIRVLLVDDHSILRQGLVELLSHDTGTEVIGEAADGDMAVAMARSLHPDVILMDISMPKMSGIDATRIIHRKFPGMIIIGLSMYAGDDREEEMRQAGASAYVSKSEAAEVLVATLHSCFSKRVQK